MDNAQKAIMIGVGLFITIIVIAAVMLITGVGQDLLNNGTQQMNDITSNIDQGQIDSLKGWNNKIVSGYQAKNILRTAKGLRFDIDEDDISAVDVTKKYKITVDVDNNNCTADAQ